MDLAFIGLGEAASAFLSGWGADRPARVTAFDIKSLAPETAPEIAARAKALGITAQDSVAEAVGCADMVFSLVTADQAVAAARAAAPHLRPGALWCDLNSCAPASKRQAAEVVTGAGAGYLDVAVMAPVHPALNMVPCLISGPEAEEMAPRLAALPMQVRAVGKEVGRASSIKMIRSIMVKGLEALTAECTLAAVAAGVEEEVLPSLKDGAPRLDVATRAAYNFERSLTHGLRRSAEMEEVARTLTDLGLPNAMAAASAIWQRRLAETGAMAPEGAAPDDYKALAGAVLAKLRNQG